MDENKKWDAERCDMHAGMTTVPSAVTTIAQSASGTVTPSVTTDPPTTSPSHVVGHPSATDVEHARNTSETGIRTPQLKLREAGVHSTGGTGLTPLEMGSGDPGAEYPGSPCAPYPLIATAQQGRAMSELALAFQELCARGSCSNAGSDTGGLGSSLTEGVAFAPRSGRLSLRGGNQPHTQMQMQQGAIASSFVADDPCVRAEELRRKFEDSQGFHFRGDACRLVESGMRDSEAAPDEPDSDPHMHQPADLAW